MMLRPSFSPNLSSGLLGAEHFQIAWATNDIGAAQNIFAQRYGVKNWTKLAGQIPAGGHIHVELAWVGGVMVELMTASGQGSAIYMSRLPTEEGFQLKLHHFGFMLGSDAEWDTLMMEVAAKGHIMPHVSQNNGFMKSCFIDAPDLGHYLEYVCPEPLGRDFFETVVRN